MRKQLSKPNHAYHYYTPLSQTTDRQTTTTKHWAAVDGWVVFKDHFRDLPKPIVLLFLYNPILQTCSHWINR